MAHDFGLGHVSLRARAHRRHRRELQAGWELSTPFTPRAVRSFLFWLARLFLRLLLSPSSQSPSPHANEMSSNHTSQHAS